MNALLRFLLLIFLLAACNGNRRTSITIAAVPQTQETSSIDPEALTDTLSFSNEFWDYFTHTFPSATRIIFNEAFANQPNGRVRLTNNRYTFGLISLENRFLLANYLPLNLSKEESGYYWEGVGYMRPDSVPADTLPREPAERKPWKAPPASVATEYLRWHRMLDAADTTFVFIIRKKDLNRVLDQ